jgi:3-(3-hydroxy-phenyl)propionate hydroxylase
MSGADVVVVGAGPVGLTAALAVRATGRPVTVVEAGAADRIRPGSRAIFIHRYTLDILNRIRPNLGHALSAQGLGWSTKRTLYRGRDVFRRTYPPPPPQALPAATSLPQVITERVLLEACVEAGVEFAWNSEVTKAWVDGGRVYLSGRGYLPGSGGLIGSARYVIGADGARSAVRESAGRQLEGPRTSNAFVIVDTAEDPSGPLPLERVFHYEHPGAGFRNVLFVPFAGHWRVDLQCNEDDDPDAFSGVEGVRRWLPQVLPAKYADRITWVSTYVFRQAIADSFVDAERRILLAGEAAHVFAPFGARGLNSGVADAFVAAQAIDAALKAEASAAGTHDGSAAARQRIDDFAETRRAAAERNRAASSTALAHLVAGSPARRLLRRTAATAAPLFPSAGRWLDAAPYGPPLGEADRDGMHY